MRTQLVTHTGAHVLYRTVSQRAVTCATFDSCASPIQITATSALYLYTTVWSGCMHVVSTYESIAHIVRRRHHYAGEQQRTRGENATSQQKAWERACVRACMYVCAVCPACGSLNKFTYMTPESPAVHRRKSIAKTYSVVLDLRVNTEIQI